jgi:hypothetical protein
MCGKNPGEFHYYLDNTEALQLLIEHGIDKDDLEFEEIRRNREKAYCEVNNPALEEMQGRLLFLKHEVMISRFHAMLELACAQSEGRVQLTDFRQGPALWHQVKVPKISYKDGTWLEMDQSDILPHRPDAFFTLSFPEDSRREPAHFLYEADRHRTNVPRFNKKLRAHYHFVEKQRLHPKTYGVDRIKAVLTETVDDAWAEYLRQSADHFVVSGSNPSNLFWFTTSRFFTQVKGGAGSVRLPVYLTAPEIVLAQIWATPVDDTLHSLLD